jgi:cation diffusion facilitator family transporter
MLDTIVSILIALLIGYGAFSILRESSGILCDKAPVLVADEIKNIVLNIKGVKDCHKIRTRGRQDDIHLDLHIIVDTSMDVNSAHNLNHAIEKAIKDKIAGVTDVVVHIEPGTKDEKSMAD